MSRDFCPIDYSIVDKSLKRFFLKRLKTPHPRFNDGAKPEGVPTDTIKRAPITRENRVVMNFGPPE